MAKFSIPPSRVMNPITSLASREPPLIVTGKNVTQKKTEEIEIARFPGEKSKMNRNPSDLKVFFEFCRESHLCYKSEDQCTEKVILIIVTYRDVTRCNEKVTEMIKTGCDMTEILLSTLSTTSTF